MALEHGEITEQIIGAAFEVYSIVGYGFLGRVYQRAMHVVLRARGLKAEIEDKIKVWYKKELVGDYQADLWVAESVIVERKVPREYHTEDEAQFHNELKATGIRVGLLINFGQPRVEFKRLVFRTSPVRRSQVA